MTALVPNNPIMIRLGLATAFALIVLPAAAKCQSVGIDALSLHGGGTRARILAPTPGSKYTLITVTSASSDSLRYSLESSLDIKSLAWQQISKMEASIGSHSRAGRGAEIGFLVGLIGGAAIGAHASKGSGREADQLRGVAAVVNGLLGGVLGGFVGGVIGSRQRTEDWVPVILPRSSVALSRSSIKEAPDHLIAQPSGRRTPHSADRE